MKTFVIRLEGHDDTISVRDKLAWSKNPHTVLVWPERGRILRRSLDLLLLQRRAAELGTQLGLVTRDVVVQEHAADLGIPVFSSVDDAQRGSWRRPQRIKKPELRAPQGYEAIQQLKENSVSIKSELVEATWKRLIIFSIGVLAVLSLVVLFLPGASVQLSLATQQQTLTLPLRASTDIQTASLSGDMPAHVLTIEEEGQDQTTTTGTVSLPVGYASGTVEFRNLTEQAIDIPAGTVVTTLDAGGARFATTADIKLDAKLNQTVSVDVKALTAGPLGNVKAGQVVAVEGNLGTQIAVANPQDFSGGSTQEVPSPTADDVAKLLDKMSAVLRESAIRDLQAQLSDGEVLLPSSIKIEKVLDEKQDPASGAPGDQVNLTLRIEFSALAVWQKDIDAVAKQALDATIPIGYEALPDTLKMVTTKASEPTASGQTKWEVTVTRTLRVRYSEAQVVQALLGQDPAQAGALLTGLELSNPPVVKLSPSWWFRMPVLPFRIQVVAK